MTFPIGWHHIWHEKQPWPSYDMTLAIADLRSSFAGRYNWEQIQNCWSQLRPAICDVWKGDVSGPLIWGKGDLICGCWCFLKYVLCSSRKLGEWSNFTSKFFQMGWFNHQLVFESTCDSSDLPHYILNDTEMWMRWKFLASDMTQQKLHAVAAVERRGNKKVWLTLFFDPAPNYLCIMRDVGSQNQTHFAQKLAFTMYGLSFCTRHWLEEEST